MDECFRKDVLYVLLNKDLHLRYACWYFYTRSMFCVVLYMLDFIHIEDFYYDYCKDSSENMVKHLQKPGRDFICKLFYLLNIQ